jgi:hypothetical protein
MTRRKKLAIAGIAVALALAAGAGAVVALRPASVEQKLKQVRKGMSYAEVVAIMGDPTHDVVPNFRVLRCYWSDKRGDAYVAFGRDGTAFDKDFFPAKRDGFLNRVLAWFGL